MNIQFIITVVFLSGLVGFAAYKLAGVYLSLDKEVKRLQKAERSLQANLILAFLEGQEIGKNSDLAKPLPLIIKDGYSNTISNEDLVKNWGMLNGRNLVVFNSINEVLLGVISNESKPSPLRPEDLN